jgi:hypothetical protein
MQELTCKACERQMVEECRLKGWPNLCRLRDKLFPHPDSPYPPLPDELLSPNSSPQRRSFLLKLWKGRIDPSNPQWQPTLPEWKVLKE